jgi:hypothetical protein
MHPWEQKVAKFCDVEYLNGKLICYLPITTPTGKVRVLRSDQPVATRQTPLRRGDVIEWQISYFANGRQRLVELGKLIDLACHHNIIGRDELLRLLSEIRAQREFFAQSYSISTGLGSLPEDFYGFSVLIKTVPVLVRTINDILIWVELRHKQRAVGFQPMLYLRIPIEVVLPNLVDRTAGWRQIVTWELPASILLSTVRAFSIASSGHQNDMIDVLTRVLRI